MSAMYGRVPRPTRRPPPIVDDSTPLTRPYLARLRAGESEASIAATLPTVRRADVPRVHPHDVYAVLGSDDEPWSGYNFGERGGGALFAAEVRGSNGRNPRLAIYRIVD